MITWTLAKKDLRLLMRDTRAMVILVAMPFLFILVLGLSLGEGFGQKPDDRMRISIVNKDHGYSDPTPVREGLSLLMLPAPGSPPVGGVAFQQAHQAAQHYRELPGAAALLAATPVSGDALFSALALAEVERRGHLLREPWVEVLMRDLRTTDGIVLEFIETEDEAKQLVDKGDRPGVLVFGPEFSDRVGRCSFLVGGSAINPFYRDGVNLEELDLHFLYRQPKSAAAGVVEQVAQGSLMRVVLPWMIGKAFLRLSEKEFIERLGDGVRLPVPPGARFFIPKTINTADDKMSLNDALRVAASENPAKLEEYQGKVGQGVQAALVKQFEKYDLTAQDWAALTKQDPKLGGSMGSVYHADGNGPLKRGAYRYQILVPSYTVMFAFFLVLTVGWLFVAERRQGTLRRLRAAPLSRHQVLLGKLIPCYLLSVVQGLFLLAAGKLVFGMKWGPHPMLLVFVVATTSLAAMGLAMLVASLARTETQVALYGTLLVLVLAGVSGCLMPRELMPEGMLTLSRVTPHAWALDAYSELLIRPEPNVLMVATACGVLTAFGVGFLTLAWGVLRLD